MKSSTVTSSSNAKLEEEDDLAVLIYKTSKMAKARAAAAAAAAAKEEKNLAEKNDVYRRSARNKKRQCPSDDADNCAKKNKVYPANVSSNQVVKEAASIKHGATWTKILCCSEGCTNYSIVGGLCIRHGAKRKLCSSEGCTNKAQTGGVCTRHGANRS